MTDLYWVLIGIGIGYFIFMLGFGSWSETHNSYPNFGMDMMYGLMWPVIAAKWLWRLPGRLMSGPSEGVVRVFRDVWNG